MEPCLPVVKEELFSWVDIPLRVDTNAMVSVDHHDLGEAVGVAGVIGKSDLVALSSSIHHVI